ncbi:MAG TPA: hypothetical protein P5096_01775 [Patescibacteria group bacterium]|nr:hypothetical protein [Patescibacteria group bacterium]
MVEKQEGRRTLKEMVNEIPREKFFYEGGVSQIEEIKGGQRHYILFDNFVDCSGKTRTFDEFKKGHVFIASGKVRCLQPRLKKENNELCELGAVDIKTKKNYWIPSRFLRLINSGANIVTQISDEKTETTQPIKERLHPRHRGALQHIGIQARC